MRSARSSYNRNTLYVRYVYTVHVRGVVVVAAVGERNSPHTTPDGQSAHCLPVQNPQQWRRLSSCAEPSNGVRMPATRMRIDNAAAAALLMLLRLGGPFSMPLRM